LGAEVGSPQPAVGAVQVAAEEEGATTRVRADKEGAAVYQLFDYPTVADVPLPMNREARRREARSTVPQSWGTPPKKKHRKKKRK
jgi:hypothetical protein